MSWGINQSIIHSIYLKQSMLTVRPKQCKQGEKDKQVNKQRWQGTQGCVP